MKMRKKRYSIKYYDNEIIRNSIYYSKFKKLNIIIIIVSFYNNKYKF